MPNIYLDKRIFLPLQMNKTTEKLVGTVWTNINDNKVGHLKTPVDHAKSSMRGSNNKHRGAIRYVRQGRQ